MAAQDHGAARGGNVLSQVKILIEQVDGVEREVEPLVPRLPFDREVGDGNGTELVAVDLAQPLADHDLAQGEGDLLRVRPADAGIRKPVGHQRQPAVARTVGDL